MWAGGTNWPSARGFLEEGQLRDGGYHGGGNEPWGWGRGQEGAGRLAGRFSSVARHCPRRPCEASGKLNSGGAALDPDGGLAKPGAPPRLGLHRHGLSPGAAGKPGSRSPACPRPHSGPRGTRPECSPSGSPEIQLPEEDGGEAAAPRVRTAGARVSRGQSLAAATVPGGDCTREQVKVGQGDEAAGERTEAPGHGEGTAASR